MYRGVLFECLLSAVFVGCTDETKLDDTSDQIDSAVPFHDMDGDGFKVLEAKSRRLKLDYHDLFPGQTSRKIKGLRIGP